MTCQSGSASTTNSAKAAWPSSPSPSKAAASNPLRPWIERAEPTYPCLIDQHHVVAGKFGMTNVPMAAWI
ncbi:MAG: hypothetical protein U5Q44_01090 [Dehalococcoidia bacterium]|nr:hypothetical protein [Dehalococcoidia bacterium]